MTKQEIDAELYKEQFLEHFKKVVRTENRKTNDIGSFVKAQDPSDKTVVDVQKMGEEVQ